MAGLSADLAACFPAEGPIAEYVGWRVPLTHAPPILHLAGILPVVAYEATRRGFSAPFFEEPTEWMAIVGGPASAKSSQIKIARAFSRDLYDLVYGDVVPNPWISLEGSMQGVLQRLAQVPVSEGRTCGVLYHTEFSRVLRNDDSAEPLCQIYDGEDYHRNFRYLQKAQELGPLTRNQGSIIAQTCFSAVVTTTPSALERAVQPDTLEGGLFSRFLWFRESLQPADLTPMPSSNDRVRSAVLSYWAHWLATVDGCCANGVRREIRYSPEAFAFHTTDLFGRLRTDMAGDGFGAGVACRALVHTARIAAIYAFSHARVVDEHIEISYDDVVRAANLVLRSREHALALGGTLAAVSLSIDKQLGLLLELVTRAGTRGVRRREIYQTYGNRLAKPAIDQLLDGAEDQGLIVQVRTKTGGRPALTVYTPAAWGVLEEQALETAAAN